jgi:hypothetical protein
LSARLPFRARSRTSALRIRQRRRSARQPDRSRTEDCSGCPLNLYCAPHKSRAPRQSHRFRSRFRSVAETLSQIRGNGPIRRSDNQAAMRNCLVSRQSMISSAKGNRRRGARGGQRLKAKAGENPCRADIPRIRDYECPRRLVQRAKPIGLFLLCEAHIDIVANLGLSCFG